MDAELKSLYEELLMTEYKDGRRILDRITSDDLCLSAHHVGRLYDNGMLIYGQAVNGWENDTSNGVKNLIDQVLSNATNHRKLHTIADRRGWHDVVDGKPANYYYKRSKFWKLNYQVVTNAVDPAFKNFYAAETTEQAFDCAWPQEIVWSNLYKVSFSKGGNPDPQTIRLILDISRRIVLREIELLKPSRVLFNTGNSYFAEMMLDKQDVFQLEKVEDSSNILYVGNYEYLPNESCRIVVCKRPDVRNPSYTNADIISEAKQIICAFDGV